MFMVFNVIFLVVTGLATAGALTADNARDERAAAVCSQRVQPGTPAHADCLREFGVTVELQSEARPR